MWKIHVFLAGWACERGKKWSSLTLNGDLGTSGCQFTCFSHGSVFVSCLESATVFSPPPTPYDSLRWLREQWENNEQSWLSFLFYVSLTSMLLSLDIVEFWICVIKCCCIFRVAGKWHSVCENLTIYFSLNDCCIIWNLYLCNKTYLPFECFPSLRECHILWSPLLIFPSFDLHSYIVITNSN